MLSTTETWPAFCQAAALYRQDCKQAAEHLGLEDDKTDKSQIPDKPKVQLPEKKQPCFAKKNYERKRFEQKASNKSATPRHLRPMQVSAALQEQIANLHEGALVRAQEAGGGGDCLFHSMSAALDSMVRDADARKHVRRAMPSVISLHEGEEAVHHMRHLVSLDMVYWTPEDFLDFVCLAERREVLGVWPDGWSPKAALNSSLFKDLSGCESVLAVGPAEDGSSDDLVVRERRATGEGRAEETLVLVPDGVRGLLQLKESVLNNFRRPGNVHWGDQTDLKGLCAQLNIGVFLLCDTPLQLRGGGQAIMYNLGMSRSDFPFWVTIWWNGSNHYRLAEIKSAGSEDYRCWWPAADVPDALLAHFRLCNRNETLA